MQYNALIYTIPQKWKRSLGSEIDVETPAMLDVLKGRDRWMRFWYNNFNTNDKFIIKVNAYRNRKF